MVELENKVNFLMALLPNESDYERMKMYLEETYQEFRDRNNILLRSFTEDHIFWLLHFSVLIMNLEVNVIDMEYCSEHSAAGMYHNVEGKMCIFNSL
jgi:hypothetical protein